MDLISTKPGTLETEIFSVIAYFDIFHYPLLLPEITENLRNPADPEEVYYALSQLCEMGLVGRMEDFYFLNGSATENIQRRRKGNAMAEQVMPRALRSAKLISRFPYVEGVCISGSLSKNYFDGQSDVDFFIITKPGRLWVCRTLLIAFKKLFLLNSKKYFCVNYFVDRSSLRIPDQNIFTATEIAYLLPVYSIETYGEFIAQNSWASEFLPLKGKKLSSGLSVKKYFIKGLVEKMMNGRLGAGLDNFLFRLTLKRWKKKFLHFNEADFDLNMRSRKNVSKHHPNGFQQKVLTAYNERMEQFREKISAANEK